MDCDDDKVVSISHPHQAAALMTASAVQGLRSVDIFSLRLDGPVYDDTDLIAAISAIARRGKQSRVRILVRDASALCGAGNILLALAQRLPSRVQVKVYTEGARDRDFGFFCVDRQHLVYFNNERIWHGFLRQNARAEARHTLNEFEHLWVYGSVEDPNLRALTL